ncbi:hypothetical protein M433DRAFT_167179 [Acidomyces richmondensis BFW]|nr:MAG: hypothetical protein FE78DRAFT_97325 [Acidomyces sp. 'richmondensis']KYG44228.1 hypothetical protein M433DRAFT_167179 [Acidomyces richmondensis BFW]
MKCLPREKLHLAKGNVLHDWHAEILAIRAFNWWILDECLNLARSHINTEGSWVKWRGGRGNKTKVEPEDSEAGMSTNDTAERQHSKDFPLFELREGISIHMYCSEAPCGDASMEHIIAKQVNNTPWTIPPAADEMLGRGNFDRLGVVRRKPARADAPQCWSKSCSDKLAMKECTGLFTGIVGSLLVHPERGYLHGLVLPEKQFAQNAVERAWGAEGRMKVLRDVGIQERWESDGFAFKPFEVHTTKREFEYSKSSIVSASSSNLSVIWTASRQEILINGVLQGRKQFDAKGASCVSRTKMCEKAIEVLKSAGRDDDLASTIIGATYAGLKESRIFRAREYVKSDVRELALKGWKKNFGDENWVLVDH